MDVEKVKEMLGLEPVADIGYMKQTWTSKVFTDIDSKRRDIGSAIYFLLVKEGFHSWHRIAGNELLFHHKGSSMKIHQFHPNGEYTCKLLGNKFEDPAADFQVCIEWGSWFAIELTDKTSAALYSEVIVPGFEFSVYEECIVEDLIQKHPDHRELIHRLASKQ